MPRRVKIGTIKVKRTVRVRTEYRQQVQRVIRHELLPPPPPTSQISTPPPRQLQQHTRSVQRIPLSSVPSLVRDEESLVPDPDTGQVWDVFISHAFEDKIEFVRPLAHALRDAGLAVWYDEFEVKWGDSLRRKIDRGVASSRFGLVVLSKHFFTKGWPEYEVDGIVARYMSGKQQILPVWHRVSKDEVLNYSPSLSDKIARRTDEHTIPQMVEEIAELLRRA